MSDTTININSLSAIQRLFGDDPEVKLAVRDSVIKRFMNHEVRNEALIQEIKAACMLKASEVITREVGVLQKDAWGTGAGKIKLAGHVATAIEDSVRDQISNLVRECAQEAIEKVRPDIQKRVEDRVTYYFNEFVDTEIKKRIDRIRSKL